MTNYEKARWFALMKAIDLVDENCDTLNKRFEDIELKPIALKHFINSTGLKIQNELDNEDKKKKESSAKIVESVIHVAAATQLHDV